MKLLKLLIYLYILFVTTLLLPLSEFYFLRHGQTDFNIKKEKKYWNMPMNQIGRKQIENLEYIIKDLPIEVIFFSPLWRTQETKDIINNYLHVRAIKLSEIQEVQESLFSEISTLSRKKELKLSKKSQFFLSTISLGLTKILKSNLIPLVIAHGAVYNAICYLLDVDTDIWHIANASLLHIYQDANDRWHVKLLSQGEVIV